MLLRNTITNSASTNEMLPSKMQNLRRTEKRMTSRGFVTLLTMTLSLLVLVCGAAAAPSSSSSTDNNSNSQPDFWSAYYKTKTESRDSTSDKSSTPTTTINYGDSDMTIELAEMISRLQAQVSELQEQRAEDRALLTLLRDSQSTRTVDTLTRPPPVASRDEEVASSNVNSGGNRAEAVARFEKQLAELRGELAGLASAKDRETERFNDVHELRLEFDGVHSECQKLRLEVQASRERREADAKYFEQQRNVQTTVRWLQKSLGELRREMGEVAAVQNISAALGSQQQCQTGLALMRTDVVALRSQLEEVRVQQDRDGAKLVQVQQDAWDLHAQQHQITANAQLFREELSELKDEVNSVRGKAAAPITKDDVGSDGGAVLPTGAKNFAKRYSKNLKQESQASENNDVTKEITDSFTVDFNDFINPSTHHRIRHQGRVRQELAAVKSSVSAIYHRQVQLDRQLRELRRNHSAVAGNVRHVWGRMGAVLNATHARAAQRASATRAIDELRARTERLETASLDANRTLANLSATVGGIDKLHSSTVQLFEALEAMEDDYSRRIGDLHDEVAKFESDMGLLSSTVSIVKQDQANHYDTLKATRGDISRLLLETDKTAYKMAALRGELLQGQAESYLRRSGAVSGTGNVHDDEDNRLVAGMAVANDQKRSGTDEKRRWIDERLDRMDARLSDFGRELNETNAHLAHKADLEHVVHWAQSADQLDEKIANLSLKLQPISDKVDRFSHQLKIIYHQFPSDCSKVTGIESGIYQIYPPDSEAPVRVFCEMTPPEEGQHQRSAWTVVQSRTGNAAPNKPTVDFDRDWSDYKNGFGSADGDYWLGNEALHRLTADAAVALRFDMWDADGRYYYAEYNGVRVEDETRDYAIRLPAESQTSFRGNVSDALRYHDGMRFSTRDRDQDLSSLQCARQYEGGWWYNHCQHVNVNGRYAVGLTWFDAANNAWVQLARVQMKLKPIEATPAA